MKKDTEIERCTDDAAADAAAADAAAAAAAADAEWDPQENGKPSSTECIGMKSLHRREGPEKRKIEKTKNLHIECYKKTREHGWRKIHK